MKDKPSGTILIFGYGSLMSRKSLFMDAPDATDIRPAYIKGFRREFSKLDPQGLGANSSPDLRNIPYCAVDVIPARDDQPVNGVVFEAREDDLANLTRREDGYELVSVEAYDFNGGGPLGKCFVFSSNARDGVYEYDNPAQERYLEICLSGAREYGEEFYEQFLATTHAGGRTINELLGSHRNDTFERWSRELARLGRRLSARLTQI